MKRYLLPKSRFRSTPVFGLSLTQQRGNPQTSGPLQKIREAV